MVSRGCIPTLAAVLLKYSNAQVPPYESTRWIEIKLMLCTAVWPTLHRRSEPSQGQLSMAGWHPAA